MGAMLFDDGLPAIHVGQKWQCKVSRRVYVVQDYDNTAERVTIRENRDRAFGMWLPEGEFLREFDYLPPSDE